MCLVKKQAETLFRVGYGVLFHFVTEGRNRNAQNPGRLGFYETGRLQSPGDFLLLKEANPLLQRAAPVERKPRLVREKLLRKHFLGRHAAGRGQSNKAGKLVGQLPHVAGIIVGEKKAQHLRRKRRRRPAGLLGGAL